MKNLFNPIIYYTIQLLFYYVLNNIIFIQLCYFAIL